MRERKENGRKKRGKEKTGEEEKKETDVQVSREEREKDKEIRWFKGCQVRRDERSKLGKREVESIPASTFPSSPPSPPPCTRSWQSFLASGYRRDIYILKKSN